MILLSSQSHFSAAFPTLSAVNHRRSASFSLNLHRPIPITQKLQLNRANSILLLHTQLRGRRSSTAAAWMLQDVGATAGVLVGGYGVVRTFDTLTKKRIIEQKLSRKLVHILSGLLYMISWPLFSASTNARYFASLVPMLNCIRLLVNGLSLTSDEGLIKSLTREGKPEELLRGPLYYVLVLIFSALLFWRDSPIGIVSVAMMCGGDGIADIMGRRFGSMKLPYNQHKSFAGSISMFLFGFLISIGMLYFYSSIGYFKVKWIETIQGIALVSLVATFVESLPINHVLDDNLSVPLSTAIATYFILGL